MQNKIDIDLKFYIDPVKQLSVIEPLGTRTENSIEVSETEYLSLQEKLSLGHFIYVKDHKIHVSELPKTF